MTTYIYLNTYAKGYLYIGSHTWDGPEGILDPNYHGSSTIATHFNWYPVKEEILEVVPEELKKLRREKYWIENFASTYGIADLVLGSPNSNKTFCNKFRAHGLLLNGHSNEPPHDHESMVKARETQRRTKGFGNMSQCHTAEARAKSLASRIANGSTKRSNKAAVLASNRYEVRRKIAERIDYSTAILKSWSSRNGSGVKRIVEVWRGDKFITSGFVTSCCKILGHSNWHCQISRKLRSGDLVVEHHGYTFKQI